MFFFRAKFQIRQVEVENAITLKRLKVETLNLELRLGIFLVQIMGAIGCMIRVSEPKTESQIRGLNSSCSKTNGTSTIKVLTLEAPDHAVSAPKNKLNNSDTFLFIYLFKQISLWSKNSETKTRNLKFGQMINLNMKLCPCDFGGATLRGLGQMHPKLVIAKFIK